MGIVRCWTARHNGPINPSPESDPVPVVVGGIPNPKRRPELMACGGCGHPIRKGVR